MNVLGIKKKKRSQVKVTGQVLKKLVKLLNMIQNTEQWCE